MDESRSGVSKAEPMMETIASASMPVPEAARLRSFREMNDDVRNAVCGALASRDLALSTKAIVMAVLRGSGETGEAAMKTLRQTSRTVVRQTAELHGDVGQSAKGLVLGAIASAKTTCVERPMAASAAAHAAIDEAGLIGWAAATRVRGALRQEIGGITVAI